MTEIIRTSFVEEIDSYNLVAENCSASPKLVREYISKRESSAFDEKHSICIYDKNKEIVLGYILTQKRDISDAEIVFSSSPEIIDFLSQAKGLYIATVVLDEKIDNALIIHILNVLHLTYCESNLNDNTKYIWMDRGVIIFTPTKQEEKFFSNANNRVSRTFYDILYKTTLTINSKL